MVTRLAVSALLVLVVFGRPSFAAPADIYRQCLLAFEPYAESLWHDVESRPGTGYFGDGASAGNGGIRGSCGIALSYAVLATEGAGDAERPRRLGRVMAALTYASGTHRTGAFQCVDGKSWGLDWQSSLWAGSMGLAAVLVEAQLAPSLLQDCQRVVAAEADRLSLLPPPSGYIGDSKAEENAWNSNVLCLAAAWLASDPRSPTWLEAAKRYLVNTYTVAESAADPLVDWISTTTLYPSYVCENHGFFHPSYQAVSGMSLGDSLLMAGLVNPGVGATLQPFAEHNVLEVWACLSQIVLDSGEFAYPSGLDWSLHGYGQISYLSWLATHFDDESARWAEARTAALLRERQMLNPDGRFTGPSVPNGFYREAVMARRTAIALLHHRQARFPDGRQAVPQPFVRHIRDAKLVLQRSRFGFFSVSYGPRLMALAIPGTSAHPDAPYVVTPRVPSLLPAGGQAEVLSVETTSEGFSVLLRLRYAGMVAQIVKVVSTGDALIVLDVPAALADDVAFPMGIENHALTGGSRYVSRAEGSQAVAAKSATQISTRGGWLCIDARLGYVAGPKGTIDYRAATADNRRGAAEDTISFMPADLHGPRFAIVAPNLSADQTKALHDAVQWQEDAAGVRLQLQAPHSGAHRVTLAMPPEANPGETLLPVKTVQASSSSPRYPADLAVDRDLDTFWVSRRGDPVPGAGPTPEAPETLLFSLEAGFVVHRIVLVPRPGYGPKQIRFSLDGDLLYDGEMGPTALDLPLKPPRRVLTASLRIMSSHAPRFPGNPRNVQVREVLFVGATAE